MAVGTAGLAGLFLLRGIIEGSGFSLPNEIQDLLTLSISVVIESLPFVILGILLSIIVQVWLPDGALMKYLPRHPVLRRACISMFGIFLPVCECGNVPLARGLIVGGFTVPEAMTFLLAAPIVNPITIITTHQAFGFDDGILVARIAGGLAIANLVGWLFSRHPNPVAMLTPGFALQCSRPPDEHSHSRRSGSVDIFVREASVIMPALFIGSLVAGAIQVLVPRDVLVTLGGNPLWSILAMMVLAFVIAVCSSVDAFFILPFASTFMPGSIATFLVFGPIIDIKMLAILRTTFTTKVLVQLTVIVALVSALIGLVVNYVA
ncbi:permease [Salinibacterium sp. CAN_S4]|uniref:permease n=1 Tax=Salinibacterium sp. CAN_S4 TaxID=2787727 RepID=UPI0018EFBB9E